MSRTTAMSTPFVGEVVVPRGEQGLGRLDHHLGSLDELRRAPVLWRRAQLNGSRAGLLGSAPAVC